MTVMASRARGALRGYALVEMAMTVATLSVLSLIAWVSYQAYQGSTAESVARNYLRTAVTLQEREWASMSQYETSAEQLNAVGSGLEFTSGSSTSPQQVAIHIAGTPPALGLAAYVPQTQTCLTAYLQQPGGDVVEDSFPSADGLTCSGSEATP